MVLPSDLPDLRTRLGFLLAGLVVLTACGHGGSAPPAAPAPTPSATAAAGVRPVALDIPAIGVHATSLQAATIGSGNAGLACPKNAQTVVWDPSEASPGDDGIAQMTASVQGAFQKLSSLQPNDPIVVHRADGSQATFKQPGASGPGVPAPDASNGPTATLELTTCDGSTPVTVYADRVS